MSKITKEEFDNAIESHKLSLSNRSLTELPPEVAKLSDSLELLSLSQNQLSSLSPDIRKCRNLQIIDLSNNQLLSLPNDIGLLASLKVFKCASNMLTSLPDSFENLKSLTVINVGNNQLISLPGLSQMTNLKELRINNNKINGLPSEIGTLPALKILMAHDNQLIRIPDSIGECNSLEVVSLDRNKLSVLPASLHKLSNLKTFTINENALELPEEVASKGISAILEFYINVGEKSEGDSVRRSSEEEAPRAGSGKEKGASGSSERGAVSRVYMRGWLQRREKGVGGISTWKKRMFVLKNDVLIVYANPDEDPISEIQCSKATIGMGTKDFSFVLSFPDAEEFCAAAESEADMQRWLKSIRKAVSAAKKQRQLDATRAKEELEMVRKMREEEELATVVHFEGILTKIDSKRESDRYFVLDGGALTYYMDKEDVSSGDALAEINLAGVTIQTSDEMWHAFTMRPTEGQPILLKAKSGPDMNKWLQELRHAISIEKRKAFKSGKGKIEEQQKLVADKRKVEREARLKLQRQMQIADQTRLEGYLTKQGGQKGGRKTWKKRYCVLKLGKLLYFGSDKEFVSGGKAKGEVSLKGTSVQLGAQSFSFVITHPDRLPFYAKGQNQVELQDWIHALKNEETERLDFERQAEELKSGHKSDDSSAKAVEKVEKRGWGHRLSSKGVWKKRWFVLNGSQLCYFHDISDQEAQGEYIINSDCQIQVETEPKVGQKHVMSIRHPDREHFYIALEALTELQSWADACRSSVATDAGAHADLSRWMADIKARRDEAVEKRAEEDKKKDQSEEVGGEGEGEGEGEVGGEGEGEGEGEGGSSRHRSKKSRHKHKHRDRDKDKDKEREREKDETRSDRSSSHERDGEEKEKAKEKDRDSRKERRKSRDMGRKEKEKDKEKEKGHSKRERRKSSTSASVDGTADTVDDNDISVAPSEVARLASGELGAELEQVARLKKTRLVLSSRELDSIPLQVCELATLESLDVGYNALTQVPKNIASQLAATLRQLDLCHNSLSTLPPEFAGLTSLRSLNLSSNNLAGVPYCIVNLTELQELYLGHNNIPALPPKISELRDLKILYVNNNKLKSLPSTLNELDQLAELVVSNNQLQSIPDIFDFLSQLTVLTLSDNELEEIPKSVGKLGNLTKLSLWNNRLRSLPPELGHLQNLSMLGVWNNQLKILPAELAHIQQTLVVLGVDNNPLESPPAAIVKRGLAAIMNYLEVRVAAYEGTVRSAEKALAERWQKLDVRSIRLQDVPPEVSQCVELIELELGDNDIRELPAELSQLTQLESLNANFNKIRSVDNLDWSGNESLHILNLCGNLIDTIPDTLPRLQKLKQLLLSHNSITELPESFTKMESLEVLYLNGNKLTKLPDIGKLHRLTELSLANNRITSLPSSLFELSSLKVLGLAGNDLPILVPEIGNLRSLIELSLSDNRIMSIPAEIGNLVHLQKLYLWNNKISGLPSEVGKMRSLKRLYLGGNKIVTLPPALSSCQNLRVITLIDNPLDSELAEAYSSGTTSIIKLLNEKDETKKKQDVGGSASRKSRRSGRMR